MRRRRVRCLCRACRSLRGFRGGGRKGWQEGATSTSIGQRCGPNHAMLGALDSDAATAPVVASRERIVLWQARTPAWAQERAARAMPPRVDTRSTPIPRGGEVRIIGHTDAATGRDLGLQFPSCCTLRQVFYHPLRLVQLHALWTANATDATAAREQLPPPTPTLKPSAACP